MRQIVPRVVNARTLSGQHAKLRGISLHAGFVLPLTLTPDLRKQKRQMRRNGSGTFTEVAPLALLAHASALACMRESMRQRPARRDASRNILNIRATSLQHLESPCNITATYLR